MRALNLTATGNDQIKIKEYLEQNVSEVLANKINNGVNITKDSKTLLNKKDLNGFVQFACEEAKKQAEKGARSAMIEDEVVFGWAIHYFEEDSIIGLLYNEDGSEYKPAPMPIPKVSRPTPPPAPKLQNHQQSLFDLLEQNNMSNNSKEIEEELENVIEKNETFEEKVESPIPVEGEIIISDKIIQMNSKPDNYKNCEIITDEEIENSFDKHTMYILSSILDGKLEIQ